MGAGTLPLFPDTRPFLMGFIGTLPFLLTSRSGPTIFLLAVSICGYSPLSKQIAICQVKQECKKKKRFLQCSPIVASRNFPSKMLFK
jgi:hypothetical protein